MGCILVDGKPSCNWVDGLNGGATIYARFDGGVTTKKYVVAGCKLVASWDSSWKDIYFRADNCLYDSKGPVLLDSRFREMTTNEIDRELAYRCMLYR
jgi:hypothetical protein